MIERETIVNSLVSVGLNADEVAQVSRSDEPVYKVTVGQEEYFIKILSDEKGAAMRKVLERQLEIEAPECRIACVDRYVLIMEPAAGRPLSLSLPVYLLPGLWRLLSNLLSTAVRAVGVALGELHAGTSIGEQRVVDDECRMGNWLEVGPRLYNHFDEPTIRSISGFFTEIREARLPLVRVHGDPTPHNIFWSRRKRKTTIIDFNLHKSVALEDPVVFEAGIELMASRLPYGQIRQERDLITSFREGYTKTGVHNSIPKREVNILKLSYYCHILDKYLRSKTPNTTRERLTKRTDMRILETNIKETLSAL